MLLESKYSNRANFTPKQYSTHAINNHYFNLYRLIHIAHFSHEMMHLLHTVYLSYMASQGWSYRTLSEPSITCVIVHIFTQSRSLTQCLKDSKQRKDKKVKMLDSVYEYELCGDIHMQSWNVMYLNMLL